LRRLRFTKRALADLEEVAAVSVAEFGAEVAHRTMRRVDEAAQGLLAYPERGRPGRRRGTRELVVPSTPFIIAYRVTSDSVDVLAVLHGARRWPRRFD
jgi:plasmid stabilization system protein ParE